MRDNDLEPKVVELLFWPPDGVVGARETVGLWWAGVRMREIGRKLSVLEAAVSSRNFYASNLCACARPTCSLCVRVSVCP